MDLRLSGGVASETERAVIDAHAAAHGRARDQLLPLLHAVNDRVGWISPGAIDHLAVTLDVAPADIFGVASFYDLFSLEKRSGPVVHRCVDIACQVNGAVVAGGERASPCLGLCERAPAALVIEAGDPPSAQVRAVPARPLAQLGDPGLVLLRRVGVVDPASLDDFRAHGGYAALRRAVALGPAGVLRELTDSGLVGRGGAAFPTGRKWAAVAAQPGRPKYVVANADESEPGTFKDRVLMEDDPFALIEAMTIAGMAVGAEKGYVYVRGEYPEAHRRLAAAMAQAYRRGYLGDDVTGHGFAFDLELRIGAGAYICGEETALCNSLEGFRGEPRSKPPFPVDVGLFGRPTLINNVETLVNVLPIVLEGGPAFAATGIGLSTGTKLYCVSGRVERPGLYELPFGATLAELLALAGGVAGGRALQAVLMGGAAGAFLTPDQLDTPLTFEGLRGAGATLGSGVVVVLDDTVAVVPVLQRIAAFFRHESCGQCVPCRVGTQRQVEALGRLAAGTGTGTDTDGDGDLARQLAILSDLDAVMTDASICGLGQTAAGAIRSALTRLAPFGAGA